MPGFMSNPFPLLAQASLFVLSSRWEGGNSLVLIEALLLGVPSVATDCSVSIRATLASTPGVRIIPCNDVEAMARAITEALSDASNAIANPGEMRAPLISARGVDPAVAAETHRQALHSLVARRSGRAEIRPADKNGHILP
jgi:glycosyltransferase involved in cell wall biosynthesis